VEALQTYYFALNCYVDMCDNSLTKLQQQSMQQLVGNQNEGLLQRLYKSKELGHGQSIALQQCEQTTTVHSKQLC
jgi:hypothetical protein